MCRWLIDQGATADAVDMVGDNPLHLMARRLSERPSSSDYLETTRTLITHGQCDPMSVNNSGKSALHSFAGPVETFRFVTQGQQDFCIDITQIDNQGIDILSSVGWNGGEGVSAIARHILDISLLGIGDIGYLSATGLLFRAVSGLSYTFQRKGLINLEELDFISELIIAGAETHTCLYAKSPLDDILGVLMPSRSTCSVELNKEALLLAWLSCLSKCQVDLRQYLKVEEEAHLDGKVVESMVYRPGMDRKFGVFYGDTPDDVTIVVEDVRREASIESTIPGSWDTEAERAGERNCLILYEEPAAAWSVSTSGFKDGDYSASRAGCDEDLPRRQHLENERRARAALGNK